MDPSLRVVTRLPLDELWTDCGTVHASRRGGLSKAAIKTLLHNSQLQFVVADVGSPLRWIPTFHTHLFWETDVKTHLAEPGAKLRLDDFQGGYAFWASERLLDGMEPIVLLERVH